MADNQALGELAAQDRYDPIVPVPDVLPRSTQVLGGLADLGSNTVDPVVLPQNPNPLADNPFSHYVAQKLYGLGQGVVDAATLPGDVYAGRTDPTSEEGGERAFNLAQMMTGAPRGGSVGSGVTLPPKGIRAYHGSPYDFDRFDLSKIGTGEGAQAYGHGLYFAENPAVAQEYRRSLAPRGDSPHQWLADAMREGGNDPAQWLDLKHRELAKSGTFGGDLEAGAIREALDMLRAGKTPSPKGKMYEVNINAHPDEFLDWDKQLSGQPKAALNIANEVWHGSQSPKLTGKDLYSAQGFKARSDASQALNEAGIPGIKYLDQGSRGSGTGTSNYVVFNDKLIDILRKYGLAGLTAGAGATAAGQQMDNSAPFGMIGAVPVAGGAMGSLARQDQYQQ